MEAVKSGKLTLHIETTSGRIIHREFENYAQLFDFGVLRLSDLPGGPQLFTHTEHQWTKRGEHCLDFSDTSET